MTNSKNDSNNKRVTEPHVNRIALVFDFDETLAPDSFPALLEHCGYEPDTFDEEKIEPLIEDGWDKKLARFYVLMQEAEQRDDFSLTSETFAEVGQKLELYPDVEEMFDRLTDHAQEILPEVEVEFYLLTAGMLEIPRATAVADKFRTLWGGELHFDDDDNLASVKNLVSYQDKIRYLLKLCKGMNIDEPLITDDVYRDVPHDEWHVPLNQLIYVGDGDSDMPVFAYLADHDGLAIGVFESEDAEGWEGYEQAHSRHQVQNLAPADYREDSELMKSLKFALESICKQIAIRQMSQGE